MAEAPDVRAILACAPGGAVAFADDWRLAYANPAAAQYRQRPAERLTGMALAEWLGCGSADGLAATLRASKATGIPVSFSAELPGCGWMELHGSGIPGGYAIWLRDVSAARRQHRAAAARAGAADHAQRINRRVFETTLDIILVVDRQGNIVLVSPSVEQILGYRPAELIGRNARFYLYPEDLDRTREEMRQARRGREMRNFETRYVHKDGHAVALAWTGIWSEAEQQHFFVGRDMTERNAAEDRLRRAQRLEAVGQLTGGIAHDFNNLLTVVIGNLDLLQSRLEPDPAASKLAESALQASLRGAALTQQLLAFARRQPLDTRVIDVNARVTAILDLLQRTLGEPIEIATALEPGLWPALVDPVQLESAVVNLAINARDAMPNGGTLLIETANKRIDADYVATNLDAMPGDYVMLGVSDTGTGMSAETLARVFEPFFTTKPAGRGTGLGLSMVYGFARQSQGHVQIYSELGEGTSVRLYLPRATGAAKAEAVAASPEVPPPARPGERILVVEDNDHVRTTVSQQLEALGYAVVAAENAEQALGILAEGDAFDLLFSDVVMPGGMSGYELAQAARALRPGLKVLLTSGFHARSLAAKRRDDAPLLMKPYRRIELAVKLRAVLDA